MNRIEIVAQHSDAKSHNDRGEEQLMQKLQELVRESESPSHDDKEDKGKHEKPEYSKKLKSPNPTVGNVDLKKLGKDPKEAVIYRSLPSPSSSENESEAYDIDEDGFEIPEGKIPIDGHFSTAEIKTLVDLAKKEGLLEKDIELKVIEENENFGDKIVLKEEQKDPPSIGKRQGSKEEKEAEEAEKASKDKENKDEKNDS